MRSNQSLVEKVLARLANIPDFPPVGTVITSREGYKESIESIQKTYPQIFGNCSEADMFALRHLLREAWKSSDPRRREWFVFRLREFHADITRLRESFQTDGGKGRVKDFHTTRANQDDWLKIERIKSNLAEFLYGVGDSELAREALQSQPPAVTEFEKAFSHLQQNLHRAVYCKNPECTAPCFFRKRMGQDYCSPDCAAWAKRFSKKLWWAKNRGKDSKKRSN